MTSSTGSSVLPCPPTLYSILHPFGVVELEKVIGKLPLRALWSEVRAWSIRDLKGGVREPHSGEQVSRPAARRADTYSLAAAFRRFAQYFFMRSATSARCSAVNFRRDRLLPVLPAFAAFSAGPSVGGP
jgi:hypothetical protein